jgi:hypothetical protein
MSRRWREPIDDATLWKATRRAAEQHDKERKAHDVAASWQKHVDRINERIEARLKGLGCSDA